MASISLYDENQLCRIISPAGVSNQLFYVHEVPEVVKKMMGDETNPNITLELYPMTETNNKTLNVLDVNSLIVDQNLNNASFDFSKLFEKLFFNSSNELNFNGTFENCDGFELSSVKMTVTNARTINDFNRIYKQLSTDYLKSHMTDTFRNAVLKEISNITPKSEQYLAYNMISAWTAYIASTYQEYVDKVWELVYRKFKIDQKNYEWSPSGLLNTTPANTSTVITKTLQYEEIKEYLYNGIKTEQDYQDIFSGNDNDKKIRFNYAIESVYILISKQIETVVSDFENMLNSNADFNFGYDLSKNNITTNFKSWLTGINNKLVNINTKYFDDKIVSQITDKSQLFNLRKKLSYKTYVDDWGLRFSKNVELINNNSEKITKTLAEDFYTHLDANRYVEDWESYYDSLARLFDTIRKSINKTLKDDLFNDLVLSIAYDSTDKLPNRIQRQFYNVFEEYKKQYSISPNDITEYLAKTTIDDKRILRAAIEKRFSEYEFKSILNIVRGNISKITDILKHVEHAENIDDDYQNSALYTKFVSLFEICNSEEYIDYFPTFSNSIKSIDDIYVCDFKTGLEDKVTVNLSFNSETVFSSTSDDDYLFNELKTNGSDFISKNITATINSLNLTEIKYLNNILSEYEKDANKLHNFSESAAQSEYYIYCNKYSNRFMLYDTGIKNITDVWRSSFNINGIGEFIPHEKFAKLLTDYYENKIELLKTDYEAKKDSTLTVELQFCINSLTNYLYDTGCYGKKTGFSQDGYVQRTIIIDSTLNRALTFNVPMILEEKGEYIYLIIEQLEAKVRELENRELSEKDKQDEFNRIIEAYKTKLQEYVDKCTESLPIAIENYYMLMNENIPIEYQEAVSPSDYYVKGKENLETKSFGALDTLINDNTNKLEKYINNVDEVYDDTLYSTCLASYNYAIVSINNYESFLREKDFGKKIDSLKSFGVLIETYRITYEERSAVNSDESTEE